MIEPPKTQYTTTVDGFSIAYQVFGAGPRNLVWIPGIVSHVEMQWEVPAWVQMAERFSNIARIAVFDKRGMGLSDHRVGAATLEQRLDDITAVMNAAAMERAALYGISEGGAMAILFAATYPERVSHLMLHGSLAVGALVNEHIDEARRAEIAQTVVDRIGRDWGSPGDGAQFAHITPDLEPTLYRLSRYAASPSTAAELMQLNLQVDVRPVLPAVSVPTLVTHCSGDPLVPVWHGRYLAHKIAGAKLVEIDADWHVTWVPEELALIGDEHERFLTGEISHTRPPNRVLATMLFTDIADSTATAARLGDAEWTRRLDLHDRVVRTTVAEWRGELVNQAGDGVLATFDGPGRAIECARAVRSRLASDGITIRAGVHTGEVERHGSDYAGIGVHIAARVQQAADPGEILVSPTVPGLVAGSGFEFADRGEHELKGVPGAWRLAALR